MQKGWSLGVYQGLGPFTKMRFFTNAFLARLSHIMFWNSPYNFNSKFRDFSLEYCNFTTSHSPGPSRGGLVFRTDIRGALRNWYRVLWSLKSGPFTRGLPSTHSVKWGRSTTHLDVRDCKTTLATGTGPLRNWYKEFNHWNGSLS